MFIKSIRLKNGYKRFHDLTIDLGESPARIIALVGPNGCGKSSVFDGMLFLHNAYLQIGQGAPNDYLYHSLNQIPNYDYQNIEVEFTQGPFEKIYNSKVEAGKSNTIFSFRSPYRFNSSVKVEEIRAIDDIHLNNYGASYTNIVDAKTTINYQRLLAKYSKYRDDYDLKPSEAKAQIIGELNKAITSCLHLEIHSLGDVQSGQGTLYFTKPDQIDPFEFNVLSSGEKEVIDILLDLYLRQDDYKDTVFLIDEPELHINSAIQKKLLIEINKLVGKECQIWIATHSIGFLRALQDDLSDECQIIYFDPAFDFGVSPHALGPIEKTRQNWLNIFETALDDLTGLVSPKRLVYCEGKAEPSGGEEQGLDAIVYNYIFSERYNDTLFVSSGGNTEPQQRSEIAIAILSKVFKDIEILVLVDRDCASGKSTDLNDRDIYLKTHPNNHRVLKRWELENYLYDKEVLKKYTLENNLTFNEATFDEKVTNIVDDNVKDKTGIIKNVCGIKTSINPELFKIELSKCITPEMDIYKELHDCIFN